ncbi:VanZ family protein [Lactobacillus sp. YT155]|uniref:VanZ family protein n=1 Tax=Lactobacillus sp. YT155 TaxID=3060955 RepID=UPI00265EE8FB|nr:VanZ family protein [Lactobacillus sp. YT155]MDO1605058.1 VanZ family protein [Lactobacillus sp. YT155]
MSKKVERIAAVIFFLMILIIFISSSMTYKQQTMVPAFSKYLTNKPFYHLLSQLHFTYGGQAHSIDNMGYYKLAEFFIRKFAHFGSYLVIGTFLWLAIYNKINSKVMLFFMAWLMTTGLAALDEFHQEITTGRTPLIDDVMLDSAGALVGILVVWLIYLIYLHIRTKKAI